jgi:hypothetical protein
MYSWTLDYTRPKGKLNVISILNLIWDMLECLKHICSHLFGLTRAL